MDSPNTPEAGAARPPEEKRPAPLVASPAPLTPPDSPLATQLPPWDLLPAHTLLVRRRPLKK
jgi:hypothetical protein